MKGLNQQIDILSDILVRSRCSEKGCAFCNEKKIVCNHYKSFRVTARKIISEGFLLGFDDPDITFDLILSHERDSLFEELEFFAEHLIELFENEDSSYDIHFQNDNEFVVDVKRIFTNKSNISLICKIDGKRLFESVTKEE